MPRIILEEFKASAGRNRVVCLGCCVGDTIDACTSLGQMHMPWPFYRFILFNHNTIYARPIYNEGGNARILLDCFPSYLNIK